MKWFLTAAAILASSSSMAVVKSEKSATIIKESLPLTLHCNKNERSYDCFLGEIESAAKRLAAAKHGDYLSYEIVKAPEGFLEGKYGPENSLEIEVKYLR